MTAENDLNPLADITWIDRVEHHRQLESTQDRARDAAAQLPVGESLLVVADRQSAGRGRSTNRWWTGEGSLAFSLLFDPSVFELPRRPIPQLSLAAATALFDAIAPYRDGHLLGLHWPNDLYVAGRKLSGVLVDALGDGRQILGAGVNTNCLTGSAPVDLRDSIASLRSLTGKFVDHRKLLESFLVRLGETLRALAHTPHELGARFNELCLQHGQALTVRMGDQSISGRCAGIAPDGALLLDTNCGRRTIYSGTLR